MSKVWWEQERTRFLDDCLAHINDSRKLPNAVERCSKLFSALDKTWKGFYSYRKRSGDTNPTSESDLASDHAMIRDLLLFGISEHSSAAFCQSKEVENLALLSPQVMNHYTLEKRDYDPNNIAPKLVTEASKEHSQLVNALANYKTAPDDPELKVALLKKIAQLLYIIRCNIKHGEKTPRGPDIAKTNRDKDVCKTAVPVIERFFDLLFRLPNERLALYGTLKRGEANHSMVKDLAETWLDGSTVCGALTEHHGLPMLIWDRTGSAINVEVLVSSGLASKFDELDAFEGSDYERVWIPANTRGGKEICNIYLKRQDGD